jgi:hypothetical protein
MHTHRRKVIFVCIFLLLIDFIFYSKTQAPTVQFIDSGELAVVCKTLGIAHPTGYPLYTIWGRLFSLLPLKDVIFRVNLMSLLFICLSNLILFFIFLFIGRSLSKRKGELSTIEIWSALLGTLIFSFTPTLWSQATSNEVYSLNVLLYSLIILLVLIWRNGRKEPFGERIFYLLVFVYALSFGNHMSTILLLPALLFILLTTYGRELFGSKRVITILILIFLGVSIYLYLPIRSTQNPIMDWGNPQSWSFFKRHVTGWQYQVWMFAESSQALIHNFLNFVKLFLHQFPLYFLPFSLLGIYSLWVTDRKVLIFFLILFFTNIIYGINYGIPDIDPYFLGAFFVNAIFVGVGLHLVFRTITNSKIKKRFSYVIMILFILLPLIQLKKNYFESDRSKDYFAYDFASNVMRSVKKDAILLTNVWDHYSPWLYLRYVELKRPDVQYLDVELCRRSWYFNYVKQNYGDLYRTSESEINRFIKEVYPFENRKTFDPQIIEKAYVDMLNSFLLKNYKIRPLYDDIVGESKIEKTYLRIPEGMVFSFSVRDRSAYGGKDSLKYYPYDFPDFELRGIQDQSVYKDDRTLVNLKRYPFMVDARFRYLSYFKREEESKELMRRYGRLLSEPIQ